MKLEVYDITWQGEHFQCVIVLLCLGKDVQKKKMTKETKYTCKTKFSSLVFSQWNVCIVCMLLEKNSCCFHIVRLLVGESVEASAGEAEFGIKVTERGSTSFMSSNNRINRKCSSIFISFHG